MFKFFILLLTTPLILDILKEQFSKLGFGQDSEVVDESQESDSLERIRFIQTIDDEIYWIEDGELYTAVLGMDGMWDPEEKTLVSLENLNRDELEKLIAIIDALTERQKKMIIGVQGSLTFDNYQVFLRAMTVALSIRDEQDKEIYVYSAGPARVNNFVAEFSNIIERSLKSRGIKIRFFKVPPSWMQENIEKLNYFAFLSKPTERESKVALAINESKSVEYGWFKFSY